MKVVAQKRQARKLNMFHLASILLVILLVFGFSTYAQASDGEASTSSAVTSSDNGSSGGDTSGSNDTAGNGGTSSSDSSGNSDNSGSGEAGSTEGSSDSGNESGGDTSEGSGTDGNSGVSSGDSSGDSDNPGSSEAGSTNESSNESGNVSDENASGGEDTPDSSTSSSDNDEDGSDNQNPSDNNESPEKQNAGSESEAGDAAGSGDSGSLVESGSSAGSETGSFPMMTMSTTGAEESDPAGTPTPEAEPVPEYQVPGGSAYIAGSEDTIYYNTATQNAIQQAIEAALTTAASQVTIIVSNGVYAGGIKVVVPAPAPTGEEGEGSGESASKMLLQIIAADAYTTDESGNITPNANSAGGVDVEGDLDFDGIDVLLAGLYLSLKNTINVKNADNVTYYGTALDDEVKINLDNVSDSVTIDSGGGDDVLNVSVRQSPSVTISLKKGEGFDADTGNLTEEGKNHVQNLINEGLSKLGVSEGDSSDSRLKVVIDGGAGDDEITVTLINSTDITTTKDETPSTAPNGVEVKLDISATDLTVNGGAGTDTITVKGGMDLGLTTVILRPILQAMLDYTPVAANAILLPGTEIKIMAVKGTI